MINVALISKWHVHAPDYARQALENPNLHIVKIWDEDKERGIKWAESLGVSFEPDLQKVLSDSEVDAVIVDTPTSEHKEVLTAAARHHKHIFTEKVLALSTEDCALIIKEVENAGINLMVSLPRLTEPSYLYAQAVLDQGLIGELTSIRCQFSHNGSVASKTQPQGWLPEHFYNMEQCGGGALIDLGAHPIYLLNRLAGKAEAVTARFQYHTEHEVEDHAIAMIEYASGALGTVETSFVAEGCPFQLELYGTEGTLLIEDQTARLKSRKLKTDGYLTPDMMPLALLTPMEQWVEAILNGSEPTITMNDAVQLTRINEAAQRSNEEKRRITITEGSN